MAWLTCPHCGEKWDSSNRYTSPANHALDVQWWRREHLSGACTPGPERRELVAIDIDDQDNEIWGYA